MPKKENNKKTYFEKIMYIPGISHAFMLLFENAIFAKLENNLDEKQYKDLLHLGINKIVELWSLSYEAERAMVRNWIEKEPETLEPISTDFNNVQFAIKNHTPKSDDLEAVLHANKKTVSQETIKRWETEREELELRRFPKPTYLELDTEILISEGTRKILDIHSNQTNINNVSLKELNQLVDGHIYLDVTTMDYKRFMKSYKSIQLCRKKLGIKKTDIRKGAPETIDTVRALSLAHNLERGENRIELAKSLGFKIYKGDNPSGSHPLYYKYRKIGKKTAQRLHDLEHYLRDSAGLSHEGEY